MTALDGFMLTHKVTTRPLEYYYIWENGKDSVLMDICDKNGSLCDRSEHEQIRKLIGSNITIDHAVKLIDG
jgi:hypothetical protein